MPIRPHPMRFTCPACGWSKMVAPRSDALRLGEFFIACPKCGCTELKCTLAPASALTRFLVWLGMNQ